MTELVVELHEADQAGELECIEVQCEPDLLARLPRAGGGRSYSSRTCSYGSALAASARIAG